jgi:hypothetical protein
MSAPAERPRARKAPGKAEKSTSVASKSIEMGTAVSSHQIRALSRLRCAGLNTFPSLPLHM